MASDFHYGIQIKMMKKRHHLGRTCPLMRLRVAVADAVAEAVVWLWLVVVLVVVVFAWWVLCVASLRRAVPCCVVVSVFGAVVVVCCGCRAALGWWSEVVWLIPLTSETSAC